MPTLRTFIALELPQEVRDVLGRVQAELQSAARARRLPVGQALKWVAPEGIHLTLKFLGAVDAELVGALEEAIAAAAAGQTAPRLHLTHVGAFPNVGRPRVLWVGLAGDVSPLDELQRRVDANLERLGFAPEQRDFSPHLTLARVREQAAPAERKAVADLLAAGAHVPQLEFKVERLSLMKSDLHPTGAVYEALHTVKLA